MPTDSLDESWPVSRRALGVSILGMLLFALYARVHGGFLLVDWANLVFHEAGHPIFGILGTTMGWYGGTLGQLVFPLVSVAAFARRRDLPSVALALFWFGENFLNIGWYMADASVQVIPLAGGGEHDWAEIFGRWHVLAHDTEIGAATRDLGWTIMLAAVALLAARAWGFDRIARPRRG